MAVDLIQKFHQNAKAHFDIDYADRGSVKKGNKAAKELARIADELNKNGQINLLIDLLGIKESKADLWAAHIVLERFNAEGETAKKALNVIRKYANSDDLNAYSEKLWLKQWEKSKK